MGTRRSASTRASSSQSSPTTGRRWSQRVTDTSDALDLETGVFRQGSARAIAASLKRSADRSRRRKSDPYRSAMSMLTFYANRAGANLSPERRRVLEKAKDELRAAYGRPPRSPARPHRSVRGKSGKSGNSAHVRHGARRRSRDAVRCAGR
jgi:hypothetical protein